MENFCYGPLNMNVLRLLSENKMHGVTPWAYTLGWTGTWEPLLASSEPWPNLTLDKKKGIKYNHTKLSTLNKLKCFKDQHSTGQKGNSSFNISQ